MRGNSTVIAHVLCHAGTSNVTWPSDFVLIKTPSHTYTANDMAQLYADLGFDYKVLAVKHVQVGISSFSLLTS